jgi:general secretion pathway protein K
MNPAQLERIRRDQGGSALLIVLLLLGLAALLISVVARSVAGAAIEASAGKVAVQADIDVLAGIDLGATAILRSAGMRSAEISARLIQGRIAVRVTNEAGRINLNSAPVPVLASLFRTVGAEGAEADLLSTRLFKWRTSQLSMVEGAEVKMPPTTAPMARALQHPWELKSILGFSDRLVHQLLPFVTVANSTDGVDPFLAPREVLLALPGATPSHVDDFLSLRDDDSTSRETAIQILGADEKAITEDASVGWRLDITSISKSGRAHRSQAVIAVIKNDDKPYRIVYVLNDP